MITKRLLAAAMAVGLTLTLPTAAAAQAGPSADAYLTADAAEAADAAKLAKIFEAFAKDGPGAIERHSRELEQILNRAPERYPLVETRGGLVIVRTQVEQLKIPTGAKVSERDNVYPLAAQFLAYLANERGDPDKAIAYLDRALGFQPGSQGLLGEKGAALTLKKDWAGALAAYETALTSEPAIHALMRAKLLRGRGFALIELHRLDEAEAAYEQSLKLEPGHGGALHELNYIRGLRQGGAKQGSQIYSDKDAREVGQEPKKPD